MHGLPLLEVMFVLLKGKARICVGCTFEKLLVRVSIDITALSVFKLSQKLFEALLVFQHAMECFLLLSLL